MASAVPFFHDPEKNVKQGARDYVATLDFTNVTQVADVKALDDIGLNALQMVYIDNGDSPAPTIITFSGTRQRIKAPPFWQGFCRVLGNERMLDYVATNTGGVKVDVHFLNIIPDGAASWLTQPPMGQQGTPLAASASGANTPLSVTFNNVAGRRMYVSTIELTGSGSTAGLVVDATLTNVDNNGAAVTLHWEFTFPTGPLVGAQPVIVSFNPPIPIVLGQNAVLSLPAGGAGNTNAAISMDGYLV